MRKITLALAFGLSFAALPALAFECGGYASAPMSKPVASTEEATKPTTIAVEQTQPVTTAEISKPQPKTN
jgi:hypothetical protein